MASLGQRLIFLGPDMGPWALGRVDRDPGDCGGAARPGGSSRALTQKILW